MHAVESVDGDFGGGVIPGGGGFWSLYAFDEFELEAIVVLELEGWVAELFDLIERDFVFAEAVDPVVQGVFRDREGHRGGLASTDGSVGALGPGEEGEEGSRVALRVAVVEVVGAGVVVVDCDFDEAEADDAGVEIDVALGVAAHSGDVVDALDAVGHGVNNETDRFVVPGGGTIYDTLGKPSVLQATFIATYKHRVVSCN